MLSRSRIVRVAEFAGRLGISRVTLWRWERRGLVPPKRKLGPNTVGWLESEIDEWWSKKFDDPEAEESVREAS